MKVLKGISAAPGIAMGRICFHSHGSENIISAYSISTSDVPNEISRLRTAFEKARAEMSSMVQKSKDFFDKEAFQIFNAHLAILNDKDLYERICEIIKKDLVNAEQGVNKVFYVYIAKYEDKENHFKELIHDFLDTRDRVLDSFGKGKSAQVVCPIIENAGGAAIIASKRLTPSMVLEIPREKVLAFVTHEGGLTSHATIIARAYGIPIIFGIDCVKEFSCGKNVIVDGSSAKVIIEPDNKTENYYRKKIDNYNKKMSVCSIKKELSPRVKTGRMVSLKVNVSSPEELKLLEGFAYEGVGLLRTEFLFMRDDAPPSEEEQLKMYKRILGHEDGRPVTVRVLDISSDKRPPYLNISEDLNVEMDLRGAIAAENFYDLYITQFRALLRANEHGTLRFLYPMISDYEDIKTFRGILNAAKKSLKKDGIKFNVKGIKEGIMIETPSSALMIEELLPYVDFVNIGTNDLLQYTVASSRISEMVEKRYHILHPSLVRLMEIIIKGAKKFNKEACLCGEIASFSEYYPLFLDIGIKSFSVSVSKFADIKCDLLHIAPTRGKKILNEYYKLKSREEIDKYFEKFI
ncbi:phosphoenolpyruvate-protein phosphotransferase [Candidatus Omnitrophus magneticus]|uniref:Phosphoenolpyruvate-protein phosphotransferase n=1 Tax=Candidatus Omnitrophus magneticus TaxID=1609969 RepID=A0A0F0CKP7_9BACT|nr:phosphoenolpyruvate-protein phosphotransferase [Candidatus Omnitrophus magneticus]